MSSDRRAIALLLLLGCAGAVIRLGTHSDAAPGAVAYRPVPRSASAPLDSVAERAARLARPLKRGDKIDLDIASAEDISRLPRIGPGLAARVVADRDEHGPFGSLEALDRVSGVGPTLLTAIKPYASFSGHPDRATASTTSPPVSLNTASVEELDQLPGIGPAKAKAIVEDRTRRGPYQTLDDLSRVPGLHGSTLKRLKGRVIVP